MASTRSGEVEGIDAKDTKSEEDVVTTEQGGEGLSRGRQDQMAQNEREGTLKENDPTCRRKKMEDIMGVTTSYDEDNNNEDSDIDEDNINPGPLIHDMEIFDEDLTDNSVDEDEVISELNEEQKQVEAELLEAENSKENLKMNIPISLAMTNYEAAGTLVDEEPERIILEDHKHLMDPEVDKAFNEVLADAQVKYEPVVFQRLAVNVLAQQKTLILISPTGSGKMNIPLWANLVLRKLKKTGNGVVIVIQPLSAIMNEKIKNNICDAAVLSMTGNLSTSDDEEAAQLSCSIEELLSGKYAALFGHPESFDSKLGMFILRELQKRDMILLLCLDEFHQGTTGHWDSFRPDMLQKSAALRLYGVDNCPTIAMSATATTKEIKETVKALGLRIEPVILSSSPMQAHIKISMVRRPANNYGLHGSINKNGVRNAGLLDLLDRLYFDQMLEDLRYGKEPKKAIIFCRTGRVLGALYANMMERTAYRYKDCRDAPFVMCHSSLLPPTEAVLERRSDEYSTYFASNRMLMGVDKKDIDIVIFTQPFNKPATTVQGGGRGGRRLKEKQEGEGEQEEDVVVLEERSLLGMEQSADRSSVSEKVVASKKRRRCQVYQLFNSQVSQVLICHMYPFILGLLQTEPEDGSRHEEDLFEQRVPQRAAQ